MRVSIEDGKCQGHARCAPMCPSVFGLDEEGFAYVKQSDVPPPLEADALLAVRNCPEGAIVAEPGTPSPGMNG